MGNKEVTSKCQTDYKTSSGNLFNYLIIELYELHIPYLLSPFLAFFLRKNVNNSGEIQLPRLVTVDVKPCQPIKAFILFHIGT